MIQYYLDTIGTWPRTNGFHMWLWLKSWFRIRKRYQILIVCIGVFLLWLFSVKPFFAEAEPFSCAGTVPMSPAAQAVECSRTLARAVSVLTKVTCEEPQDPQEPPECTAPDEDGDGLARLAESLNELPLGWVRPKIVAAPLTITVPANGRATHVWAAIPNDRTALSGRMRLAPLDPAHAASPAPGHVEAVTAKIVSSGQTEPPVCTTGSNELTLTGQPVGFGFFAECGAIVTFDCNRAQDCEIRIE